MTKKCSKNELFNVERQFLESCTSDLEEMNKVKFQSINRSGNGVFIEQIRNAVDLNCRKIVD